MTECWINVYQTPSGKQYVARPCASPEEANELLIRSGFMARVVCRLHLRMKPA